MVSRRAIRNWYLLHKWSSLIATVFLLMLCITGLPLIFQDEIEGWLNPPPPLAAVPEGSRAPSLDAIAAAALAAQPGQQAVSLGFSRELPAVLVQTAPAAGAPPPPSLAFDLRTGNRIDMPLPKQEGFMHFVLELHTKLFAGLPGALFLGAMGLLLIAAVVSGVAIYAPFMRKLRFGTLRLDRSARVKWLDLHNLLGIATVAWVLVVGATGAINTLHDPIAAQVRVGFAEKTASYRNAPPARHLTSLDAAVQTARSASPGMSLVSCWDPGTRFSTPHHYAVFLRGNTPLTSRMLSAVLIDAETGKLSDKPDMAWYAKALFLSQPLHFGDYGGLPLKILWTLFDLVTIAVLVSGLVLWFGKRGVPTERRVAELEAELAQGEK